MHFAVLDIEEKTDDHGNYIGYGVYVNGGFHSFIRYRQLRELHEQLKKEFGDIVPDKFPPKKLLSLNQAQLEERREQLEKYLQFVSQVPELVASKTFAKFLLKSQRESNNVEEDDVKLDIYLMNGKKFSVEVRNTDSAEVVMQAAMSQIKLPDSMIKYFALFLVCVDKEDENKLTVVRKLQKFESPTLILLPLKDTYRLVVRKSFWASSIEDKLFEDKIALNLLFVQAVSDVERDWVITTSETLQQLNNLKKKNERKQYLKLARSQKFYGYLQFKPCVMDFPEVGTHVIINIGGNELNFRLIGTQKTRGKEGSFKVTRVRCWRVVSTKETGCEEVVTKIAFEYLFSKDKLQWVTITSDQAMLMSLCLQGMVDEIVKNRTRTKAATSEISKPVHGSKDVNDEKSSSLRKEESSRAKEKEEAQKSSSLGREVSKVKKQDSLSRSSTESTDGPQTPKNSGKQNEQSVLGKRLSKKSKKQMASVQNEVFAQDIQDEDL